MKSALVNGCLPDPPSLSAALARHQQVFREIDKVEGQVGDPARAGRYSERDYGVWRRKARAAIQHMREESRQLALWIDAHPDYDLLADVRRVFQTLREDFEDPIEFEPDELAVIARVEVLFANGKDEKKEEGM